VTRKDNNSRETVRIKIISDKKENSRKLKIQTEETDGRRCKVGTPLRKQTPLYNEVHAPNNRSSSIISQIN
jgi:hypothetical protein